MKLDYLIQEDSISDSLYNKILYLYQSVYRDLVVLYGLKNTGVYSDNAINEEKMKLINRINNPMVAALLAEYGSNKGKVVASIERLKKIS